MALSPQALIDRTNQYRVEQGLPPLKLNPALQKAAETRARDMATTGNFSHSIATSTPGMQQPWGFMKQAGYEHEYAGENLAVLFDDPNATMEAWKKSPGHNKNLVNDKYQDIGIGIVPGTYKGKQTNYVVQFFGSPKVPAPKATSFLNPPRAQAASIPKTPTPSAPVSIQAPRISLSMPASSMPQSTPMTIGTRPVEKKLVL